MARGAAPKAKGARPAAAVATGRARAASAIASPQVGRVKSGLADARRDGRLRRALLAWFDVHRRDLPWRRRRSPYSVWVSEVMLQQTRTEAVVEPYRRFLTRFPTLAALAGASADDVLAAWSGLGYYRRARLLHAGARVVAGELGGRLPRSPAQLRGIPGIGEYTAAAIAAIAFGQPVAAIDANVARVLARVFAIGGDVAKGASRASLREAAEALVDPLRPGDFTEALMDLGATLCTARAPRCAACPLARSCRARQLGRPQAYPVARARKAPQRVRSAVAVIRRGSGRRPSVLFVRRGHDEDLMAGMWDLPSIQPGGPGGPADVAEVAAQLRAKVLADTGLRVELEGPHATLRHSVVGRDMRVEVYVAAVSAAQVAALREHASSRSARVGRAAAFFGEREFAALAVSSLPLKAVAAVSLRQRRKD